MHVSWRVLKRIKHIRSMYSVAIAQQLPETDHITTHQMYNENHQLQSSMQRLYANIMRQF